MPQLSATEQLKQMELDIQFEQTLLADGANPARVTRLQNVLKGIDWSHEVLAVVPMYKAAKTEIIDA